MKKRIISVVNWDKYQARSDKELPWLKLWGRLFKAPWFQNMSESDRFVTICILDLARQMNNKIDSEILLGDYFLRVYGVFMTRNTGVIENFKDVNRLCNYLYRNGFLSDNCQTNVRLEGDKIRQDKRESDKTTPESFEKFWKSYPKRKSKGSAEKAWQKITPNEQLQERIFRALEWAKTSVEWTKDGGRYIPYPATWLNAKGWEDETEKPKKEDAWDKPFPTCQTATYSNTQEGLNA